MQASLPAGCRLGPPISFQVSHPSLCDDPVVSLPLLRSGKLHETLTSTEVGILIRLRLRREGTICSPQIDQRLHGLQLRRSQHIQRCRRKDEVRKATVELLLEVQVVKWISEVRPVQVGVDTEHLTEDD